MLLLHQGQGQFLDPLPGHGEADQAPAVFGHEIDRVRRRHLGRDHEVALVLPVLIVDEDEHAAVPRLLEQFLRGRQGVTEADREGIRV